MLESLHVKNYVLIDNLDLDFYDGFSCITGETGSGKTIILEALSLLLGQKADKEAVRFGASFAEISAVFSVDSKQIQSWLEEHDIDYDDEILVKRIIKVNGRSSYSVNSSPITRQDGEILGALLVDVSSQHAHQSLMKDEVLLDMLDQASDSAGLLSEYKDKYNLYKSKNDDLSSLKDLVNRNAEEEDYLRYCLSELDKADLKDGEEEELKSAIELFSSSEFLTENISNSIQDLKESSALIGTALTSLRKAARKDPSLLEFSDRLESQSIEIEDIYQSLRDYLGTISFSEFELAEKNERLATIQKIKRRFGGSIQEAIKRREEYRDKLEMFSDSDFLIEKLEKELASINSDLDDISAKLTQKREKGALKLEKAIEENLSMLGMQSARMRIEVLPLSDYCPSGKDCVVYKIAANKGEKFSDIQSSSSGGELSRLLLALKVSLNNKTGADTMLFDEIDSGIGGTVANNVSELLSKLSLSHQVLAITHLSQLAVKAKHHYLVAKKEVNGRTISYIHLIDGEERVKEIARLLSGEMSDISLEHARALLEVEG